jgi:hypothetical protein
LKVYGLKEMETWWSKIEIDGEGDGISSSCGPEMRAQL